MPDASRPGDTVGIGREDREIAIPPGGEFAPLHQVDFGREIRVLGAVRCELFGPLLVRLTAAFADAGGEVLVDTIGHQELRVLGPSVKALDEADFFLAKRLAVGRGSVVLVRGTVADVAVEHDEGGAAFFLSEDLEGVLDTLKIVGIAHSQNVPSVCQKARRNVLSEGDAGGSLDRDVVVVVDPAEVVQAQVAGY